MEMIIILALAFGAMWLMTSRTRKQQKKAAEFRANLEPGQEVMTGSGLFGTIVAVDDEAVTLETSPGVTSRWLRPAIAKLVEPPVDDELDEDEDEFDDYDEDEELEDDAESDEEFGDGDAPEIPDDASSLIEASDESDEDDTRR